MTTFFTSDTHFGHARIIELCNRPFKSVEEMNETLISNWNSVVSPTDHVYHLGDVVMGSFKDNVQLLGRLNGTKTLVTGNHDRTFRDPDHQSNPEKHERDYARFLPDYQSYFKQVEVGSFEHAAELLLIPEMGVNLTTKKNTVSGVLRMSHFPYQGDSHDKPRFDQIRPKDDGKVLLHGHTHSPHRLSVSAQGTQQIHVGVDSWDYFPVALETILKLVRN